MATYAVGFGARPVGGFIFGSLGDRLGRRTILVITLVLMGVATAGIGLLPTYGTIGVWAPILLVALRIVQGLGAGAEFGGAAIMAVENAPKGRRGLYGSIPSIGIQFGLVLATGVFALFATLPEEQFLAWGWRVPFLLSISLLAVGLYVRLRLFETPAFEKVKKEAAEVKISGFEVVRQEPRSFLTLIGMRISENTISYAYAVFVLTYTTQELGLSDSTALTATILAAGTSMLTQPAFAALSDRIGRRPVNIFGGAFTAAFAFPFWLLVNTGSQWAVWAAVVLGIGVGAAANIGLQGAYFLGALSHPPALQRLRLRPGAVGDLRRRSRPADLRGAARLRRRFAVARRGLHHCRRARDARSGALLDRDEGRRHQRRGRAAGCRGRRARARRRA